MRRREFIILLGSAAAWPLAARSQQPGRTYRIAFLANSGRQAPMLAAFFDELRLNGFTEGQNLDIVVDGFNYRDDQIDGLVAAIMKAAPDAVLSPEPATRELQKLTKTIPIICMTEDMLEAGLVPSLARPGGNTSGISLLSHSLDGKRLDILREIVPGARNRAPEWGSARLSPCRNRYKRPQFGSTPPPSHE
jgi:putative ABC transport system substrate-binding protein